MNYKELTGLSIREGFEKFHHCNPHIYKEFEEQALKAINKGRKKISAKLIINWIRWNKIKDTTDENFHINDAFQSYYARLFAEKHPQHSNVFEYRKLRNEQDGPFMEVDEDTKLNFL